MQIDLGVSIYIQFLLHKLLRYGPITYIDPERIRKSMADVEFESTEDNTDAEI